MKSKELKAALTEIKDRLEEIKDKLEALEGITPRNEEEHETFLEQVGKLQAEGKRLGDRYRTLRVKIQND